MAMNIILHIVLLLYTLVWYNGGTRAIVQKRQYSLKQNNFFKRPISMIREGNDAVMFGKFERAFAVITFITAALGILGVHDFTFGVFFILLILENTVVWPMYPMKPEYDH